MLLRRILGRKMFFQTEYKEQKYDILYSDPSSEILVESDYIYKTIYDEYLGKIPTLEETYQILNKTGKWSEKDEDKLKSLENNIKKMRGSLPGLKFKKKEARATQEAIEVTQTHINKLLTKKYALANECLEAECEKSRKRFLIVKSVKITPYDHALMDDAKFIDQITVLIDREDGKINEKVIRELARSQPFRGMWRASQETGTPLFDHSACDMTDFEQLLVSWALIYDYAYSTQEPPSDQVINDDAAFDAWYENHAKAKKASSNSPVSDNSGLGFSEVFVMADEEGAKEVYELNSLDAKAMIKSSEDALKKKGEIKDQDLPHVKRMISMEANKRR